MCVFVSILHRNISENKMHLLPSQLSYIEALYTYVNAKGDYIKGLTHCILVDSSNVKCWTSPFVILGVSGLFCPFYSIFHGKILLANTVDPDQMPH